MKLLHCLLKSERARWRQNKTTDWFLLQLIQYRLMIVLTMLRPTKITKIRLSPLHALVLKQSALALDYMTVLSVGRLSSDPFEAAFC